MAELPDNHPFKDSQTLQELQGKGSRYGPPEFRRILFMTFLLAAALGVIAWQASKRAAEMDGGSPPKVSLPKEGSPLAQDEAVHLALAAAAKATPEQAASLVRPDVGVQDLLQDPEKLQGTTWVRVSGIPISMSADKLDPNPAGVVEAWRTYVVDRRTREAVCLWTVERPREWDEIVLCHDLVECEGVFVRLVTYETEDGSKRTAPLVVARSLARVQAPADRSVQEFQWAIGVMIAIVGVALVLLVLHGRREEARHKERLQEALGPPPRKPADASCGDPQPSHGDPGPRPPADGGPSE